SRSQCPPISPEFRRHAKKLRNVGQIVNVFAVRAPFADNSEQVPRTSGVYQILLQNDGDMADFAILVVISDHVAGFRILRSSQASEAVFVKDSNQMLGVYPSS